MTNGTTPRTSGADWPPGLSKPPAPRGAPEQSDAFAGMLDQHQARTAIAEGHQREGRKTDRPEREKTHGPNEHALERRDDSAGGTQVHGNEAKPEKADSSTPTDPTTGTGDTPAPGDVDVPVTDPVAEPVAVSPLISLMGALNPTVTGADAPVATAATANAANTQVTPAATAVAPQAATATAVATLSETAADGGVTATTGGVAAVAEGAGEALPNEVPDAVKPAAGDAKPQEAARVAVKPAAQPADTGAGGYKQPGTGSEAAATPARPATPATGERPATPAVPSQNAQQQQPAAAAAVNAPQHASAVSRGESPLASGVPLSRAAETVEHVLRLAATRGSMQARVSLKPAELGSLEVVIRQTAAGLTARVVADDAGAAQVLQQAGSELRRSLEQQGITLLNLDIGQSGDDRSLGRSSDGAREGRYEGGGNAHTRSGGTVAAEDATSTETTVRLPNGALIDVLA